jgi:hypothetical protein
MGKTHSLTEFIANINSSNRNEYNNVTTIVNSDPLPIYFTPVESTNGYIFVPDDKGVEYTQMLSLYADGIDSNFSLDYSYFPSKNGILLLGGVTIYYNDKSSPVAISNPANLMVVKEIGNNKLTGNFSVEKNNKPGFTIVSSYDTTNNINSRYYHVYSEYSVSTTITDMNEFDINSVYDFEIIGESGSTVLTLKIKKNTADVFGTTNYLDINKSRRIGFLANSNVTLSNVRMYEYQ